jgi:transposase
MQTITTIGLDIAKSVFQVHGVDAAGEVVIRRQLKRRSVLVFFQKLVRVANLVRLVGRTRHTATRKT